MIFFKYSRGVLNWNLGEFSIAIYMDGVELADQIISEKDNLKIILSSGYSDRKVARSEIRKKDNSFIQKPYDVVKLLKIVHETLN